MKIETLASEIQDIAKEILEKEVDIFKNERDISESKMLIEQIKFLLEKEVLFNLDFKNEGQRKNALSEKIAEDKDIQNNQKDIEEKENYVKDVEFDIKKLKIEKTYKETILKLEFI